MKNEWITDRNPTEEECEEAGDVGFIVCISGQRGNEQFHHAIIMDGCWFGDHEDERWLIEGWDQCDLTVHGWMLPPTWEEREGEGT